MKKKIFIIMAATVAICFISAGIIVFNNIKSDTVQSDNVKKQYINFNREEEEDCITPEYTYEVFECFLN